MMVIFQLIFFGFCALSPKWFPLDLTAFTDDVLRTGVVDNVLNVVVFHLWMNWAFDHSFAIES